ncbi:glycerophosphodiester phosphodiesterase [Marinobacteraceae bacterium S3BR75-40.1]
MTPDSPETAPFDLDEFRERFKDILQHRTHDPIPGDPVVIAHRGASGYVPEHTLESYTLSVLMGADFVEPDLVMTRDNVLIARHDNQLHLTTNVTYHPTFADRERQKSVDGVLESGWFVEDFSLAEIKELRAIERIPNIRPANTAFDALFEVPTFQEIIDRVRLLEKALGRTIGIYPETKHPTHFAALGMPMDETLVKQLHANGYEGREAPIFIQSFEITNLKKIRKLTELPLIQLMSPTGQPFDAQCAKSDLTYDTMATREGLQKIAEYADGVGPEKYHFILPRTEADHLDESRATDFVKHAHEAGLKVHPYTFRAENFFLPHDYRIGDDQSAFGKSVAEVLLFLKLGIDGFFIDQADVGVEAKRLFRE